MCFGVFLKPVSPCSGSSRFTRCPCCSMRRGWGVQEAAIMVLEQLAGVDRQAAIALALVKRMREVLFGCIALAGWQLAEMRRASRTSRSRLN